MTNWTHQLRRIVNWVNLSTPVGLLIALIGKAHIHRGPQGLILAENYRFAFPKASAFTVGNVVITNRSIAQFESYLPRGMIHEAKHSTQYAWLGPLFLPLYLIAMGVSWLRTRNHAAWNPFEIWAGLADGGYRQFPKKTS